MVVLAIVFFLLRRPRPVVALPLVLGRGYADQSKRLLPDHIEFSDRVLIIRDPDTLRELSYDPYPTPDGSLSNPASFKSLIERAGAKDFDLDRGDYDWVLDTISMKRLRDRWPPDSSGKRRLDQAPFRLEGIAFRPDLADFLCAQTTEGNDACGAEIHFDFGLTDANGKPLIGLIVEFTAPRQCKQEYQDMVKSWRDQASIADSKALAGAISQEWSQDKNPFTSARIRLSALGATAWQVREYSFDGNGKLNLANNLPGEIDRGKWIKHCILTQAADAFCKKFGGDARAIDPWLLRPSRSAILTPDPLEIGKSYSADLRYFFATHSCSGCHSDQETGTPVLQIKPRDRCQKSLLSSFLTGASPPGYGEPTTGYYSLPDPGTCNSVNPVRSFNDLLRRHEYIDAIASFSVLDANWTAELRRRKLGIRSVH